MEFLICCIKHTNMPFSGIFSCIKIMWMNCFSLSGRSFCLKITENLHVVVVVILHVQLEKCLHLPNDFGKGMHSPGFPWLFFLRCLCLTVAPFLSWKCFRLFPSDLICLTFFFWVLAKVVHAVLGWRILPECVIWWFSNTCLLLSNCSLQTCIGVVPMVGSVVCISELCFWLNPYLMIAMHMFHVSSFISLAVFCHTPTVSFLRVHQEADQLV